MFIYFIADISFYEGFVLNFKDCNNVLHKLSFFRACYLACFALTLSTILKKKKEIAYLIPINYKNIRL